MKYGGRRVDVDGKLEETAVEAILEELARDIHASVGVRMHRLGVWEWEVKLWITSSGQANGAWRVVVTNVTGHTCTVHVSFHVIHIYARKCFQSDPILKFNLSFLRLVTLTLEHKCYQYVEHVKL